MKLRIDPDGNGIWLGDQHVPHGEVVVEDRDLGSGFECRVRQAKIPGANGLTLSIVWGTYTHSSNWMHTFQGEPFMEEPEHVEIAVLKDDGDLVRLGGDYIMSHVPVSDLSAAMDHLAALPPSTLAIDPPES